MSNKKEELPDWESKQIQKVTDWLNEQLPKGSKVVQDLEKDLSDGVVLITLVETIKKCTIPGTNKNATSRIHKIANLTVVLNFIEEELDVRLPVIGPEDIVDGNIKLIMGTLWALMRYIAPTDAVTNTLHHDLTAQTSSNTRKQSAMNLKVSPRKEQPRRTPARVVVAAQAKKIPQPNEEPKKMVVKPAPKPSNKNKIPPRAPPSKDADSSDTETESEDEIIVVEAMEPTSLPQETKPQDVQSQVTTVVVETPEEQKQPASQPEIPQPEIVPETSQESKQEDPEQKSPEPIKQEEVTPEPAPLEITGEPFSHEEVQMMGEPKQEEVASPRTRTSFPAETAEIEMAKEAAEIIVPPPEQQQELKQPEVPALEESEPAKPEIVVEESHPEPVQQEIEDVQKIKQPESVKTAPIIPVLSLREEKPRTSSVEDRIRHSPGQSPRSPRTPGRTERSGSMQRKNSVFSPPALPATEKVEKEIASAPFLTYYEPEKNKLCTYRIVLETTNIGRRNDNDIILVSKYISRYHARIDSEVKKGETVLVFKDLDSSGGSRVNGGRANNKVLEKGDQIKLGKTVMLYSDKSDKLFLNGIIKEGPGYKQRSSLLKSWQARYFVLQGHVIFYFKSNKERRSNVFPDGFIDIDQCIIEQDEKNWFTIKTNKKAYSLKFNPPDEKDDWLDAIKGR